MAGITFEAKLEPFEIMFGDKKEVIYFYSGDSNLPERLLKMPKIIIEKTKKLKIPEVKKSDKIYDNIVDYLDKKNKIVCDAVDYAFGNKVSDVLFKYYGPYSIINGKYYILDVIERMVPEIVKMIDSNQELAAQDLDKYKNYFDKYKD